MENNLSFPFKLYSNNLRLNLKDKKEVLKTILSKGARSKC